MKMTKLVYLLLLIAPCITFGSNIESIDVEIDSLNFIMPKAHSGEAGSLKFKSLDFYSSDLFLNLYDEGAVFDSKIYIRPDFFGIRGSNHALGVNLDTTALSTVSRLDLEETSVGFNEKKISFDTSHFFMEEESVDVDVKNATFYCKKDKDHTGMDLDAIKYGCLSYSSLNARDEVNPIEINALLKAKEEDDSEIQIDSKVKHVEFRKEKIYMNSPHTSIVFDQNINMDMNEIRLACNKNGNLDQFDPNKLIFDCLDDVSFHIAEIDANGTVRSEDETEETSFDALAKEAEISLDKSSVSLKAKHATINYGDISASLSNALISCNKDNEQISNEDFKGIIASCLDTSHIEKLENRAAQLSFNVDNESFGKIHFESAVDVIDFEQGDISTSLVDPVLGLGDDVVLAAHNMDLKCETNFELPDFDNLEEDESVLDKIDFDKSIESCLNGFSLPATKIFVTNAERQGQYFLDVKAARLVDDKLLFDLPGVQLTGDEGSNTLLGIKGSCEKFEDASASDYLKLISGCTTNSNFTISKAITDEDNDEFGNKIDAAYNQYMTKRSRKTPIDLVRNHDVAMKLIKVKVTNGYMRAELKTDVLFSKGNVEIEGRLKFNENTEKLTIDITKTKLPYGIGWKWLSLKIIKFVIGDDMIDVDSSDKKIVIDLSFK